MKISALIAEFNPFHKGHKFLIDNMKNETDGIIAIMSGNFVQRGECAIFEKGDRAKAAVKNGVDLVLELPTAYALASAEVFAKGAIQTLSATGCVDELHFGSECGDIEKLSQCADILSEETPEFKEILSENLHRGLSFPAARQAAVESLCEYGDILSAPNNTLAVEYIKEIKKSASSIKPCTIKRIGAGYNDTSYDGDILSASAIRTLLQKEGYCQKHLLFEYESKPTFSEMFDTIVAAKLKTISRDELMNIPDCNEELASRLCSASVFNTFLQITENVSCRNYTQSRIRRILCNMLISNHFTVFPSPTYIRPLAFNKRGSEILKKIKSTASLPIASRGAVLKNDEIFSLECRSTDIYNLVHNIPGGLEFNRVSEIID